MQIKKTRLKQIIAEEIARFDTLSEEEKVDEGLFGNIGRGAFGRRAQSSRRTGGATPTADDTAERAADELEKAGKEVGLRGQGAKAYDQAMASAALMDKEASEKDYRRVMDFVAKADLASAREVEKATTDALNNALEIIPDRILDDKEFLNHLRAQLSSGALFNTTIFPRVLNKLKANKKFIDFVTAKAAEKMAAAGATKSPASPASNVVPLPTAAATAVSEEIIRTIKEVLKEELQ